MEIDTIEAGLAKVFGVGSGVTAKEIGAHSGLVVVTSAGVRSFPMAAWIPARERLLGRFTGDERHPDWQNDPTMIAALLPGAVNALLSADEGREDKAAALVAAIGSHVARDVTLTRLAGLIILHGQHQTRAIPVHAKPSGFL